MTIDNYQNHKDCKKCGDLNRKNDILHYYKADDPDERPVIKHGIDKLDEAKIPFDPKAKTDTLYPEHVRFRQGLKSKS